MCKTERKRKRERWGYQWTDCLQVTSGERKRDQVVTILGGSWGGGDCLRADETAC